MTANDEFERIWAETVVAYFMLLFRYLKETREPQTGQSVSRLRFEPGRPNAKQECQPPRISLTAVTE
jgi:hypothetical protein